ncbi:MAG: NHL repeat-containing protein [Leptospiraceae bacterium]|nr:NHL repeat-containing protein [Leptospiraceae bacterium]
MQKIWNKSYFLKLFFFILFAVILFIFESQAEELPEFRIGKEQARTYFKKGVLQLNNYQYGAAKESFLSALNVMEDFYLARKMLSDAYYLSGEWQESLSELEIIEKRGRMNPIWKNRAEILRLGISGYGRKDGLTFYKYISGDAFRGYRFRNPTDAVVDEEGFLYVVGHETTNVVKFDPNGLPVSNIKGGIGRTFDGPSNIAVHKDTLYVSDLVSNFIYRITTKGRMIDRFGGHGIEAGLFHGPAGLAISNDEHLYVVDTGNARVQKFTLDGKFVLSFGQEGKGKLIFPYGIAIENEEIYVVDRGNRRIVVYDNEGNYKKEITHSNIHKPRSIKFFEGKMYITDEMNGVLIYNPSKDKWTKITNFRDTSGEFSKILRPFSTTSDYTPLYCRL